MTGTSPLAERLDRRRDAATRAIERAAVALFAERGFDRVSVDDVAVAAGISQRTFFRYFASKDDILLGYRRRLDVRLLAALADRPPAEGPVTALRNAFLATSTVPAENREDVLLRARATAAAPALHVRSRGERSAGTAAIAAVLAERMRADPDDRRARVIATAMSAVATAEWEAWVAGDGTGDPATQIAAALHLVEQGLGVLDRPDPAGEGS
ncbi:TetR family transcriptional regulator [Pseudonocardia sp. NPDC049154]|uniref:TetR family transcriptional regulator n=1 Tax=Pseudonocardia sp. NPDC049154 TaxID=3155501 RepID=UPI0033FEBE7C